MNDPLAPLRARFRERMKSDLARFRTLRTGDLACDELKMLVHGLAGAAGTFGYASLSHAAMEVDDRYSAGSRPDAAQLDLLERAMIDVADAG